MSSVSNKPNNDPSMFEKISTVVSEKAKEVLAKTKTESTEILARNTRRGETFGRDQAVSNRFNNTNIEVNQRTFDPVDKLPENLRGLYRDVEKALGPTEQSALQGLLKSGKLTMKDSTGKTIMENLAEIKNSPMKAGVRPNELLKDAVLIMSDRKYITQGPHGTCGAGSIENHLWKKDPAELLRIVKDIAKNGEATLRDGSKLKAGTNSLGWHEGAKTTDGSVEDRRDFNTIFQSAVMRNVAVVGGDRAFGNAHIHDLADYNVNKDNSDASSVSSGDSAANPVLVTSLLGSITGHSYSSSSSFVWGGGSRIDDLDKASKAGKQPIALFSQDGYFGLHYVVVQEIKDGKVYFQNTAKDRDYGQVDSMSVDDFKKKVRDVIIPD